MTLAFEGPDANDAFERLLPTVHSEVERPTALSLEGSVTHIAFEWAIIPVHLTVLAQAILGLESQVAVGTLE